MALKHAAAASLAALLPLAAAAEPAGLAYAASHADGRLQFTATLAGGKFTGQFGHFSVSLDLGPDAAPERLLVTIETTSANTQDEQRDDILRSGEFFAVAQHPQARYQSTGFRRDGEWWLTQGMLSLRGVERPVPVQFSLWRDSRGWSMTGTATLRRLDFGVGQGDWRSTEWVGDVVELAFELRLRPVPGSPD